MNNYGLILIMHDNCRSDKVKAGLSWLYAKYYFQRKLDRIYLDIKFNLSLKKHGGVKIKTEQSTNVDLQWCSDVQIVKLTLNCVAFLPNAFLSPRNDDRLHTI